MTGGHAHHHVVHSTDSTSPGEGLAAVRIGIIGLAFRATRRLRQQLHPSSTLRLPPPPSDLQRPPACALPSPIVTIVDVIA